MNGCSLLGPTPLKDTNRPQQGWWCQMKDSCPLPAPPGGRYELSRVQVPLYPTTHVQKKYMYSYPVSSSSYDWLLEASGLATPDLTQAQGLYLVRCRILSSPRSLDSFRPPRYSVLGTRNIMWTKQRPLLSWCSHSGGWRGDGGGWMGKYSGIFVICRPLAFSLPNLLVLQGPPGQGPPAWCSLPSKPAFTSSLHADFHLMLCATVSCFILSTTVLLWFISSSRSLNFVLPIFHVVYVQLRNYSWH